MAKKYIYLVYGIGILICIIILKTYKPKGFLNFTNFFVFSLMLVLIVALLAAFLTPSTFGVIKKILFSLLIGIGAVVLLFFGINSYDTYQQRSSRAKQLAKVKEHKEYYASWDMLENITVEYGDNEDVLLPITAEVVLTNDAVLNGWDAELFIFARPPDDDLINNYNLFKSDKVLVGNERKLSLDLKHAWHIYYVESLYEKVGDTVNLEYLLLLKNPEETYSRYGLNEGLAYTSLPVAEIEVQNGIYEAILGKKYTLIRSSKMPASRQIPFSVLKADRINWD